MVRVKTPQNTFKPSQVAKPAAKPVAKRAKPVRKRASSPDIIYLLDSDSSSDEDEPPVVEMYVHESGAGPRAILDEDEDEEDELEEFKDDLEEDELEPTPARAKSEDDFQVVQEPYDSPRSEYKPSPSPDAYEPPSKKSGTKRKSAKSKSKRQPRQSANGHGGREQRNVANRANLEPAVLEPQCLPPVETTVDNHWTYLFFRFCAERHEMYGRREAGCPREQLSEDETMMSIHIGNVFRQLDPSSSKIRANIIEVGDQSPEEVCFRVFLYCMFYKDPTWEALCAAAGGIPTWKNYESDMPAMEAALHDLSVVKGQKLYYGGFQIVPPNIYFTDDRNKSKSIIHYASSLRLCKYAVDALYVLRTVPTIGGFLGLNIMCFLNDTTNFKFQYRDFATCGPGSRLYLQRMFGKQAINCEAMELAGLKWLCDNQWRYWARLGIDPPHEWKSGLRPGMRVLDFENALCWAHRYVNAYETKGTRSLATLPPPQYDPEITESCSAPAWCVEEKWLDSSSRTAWDAEFEENERVESLGDDYYEIEKVVARLGSGQDPLFRVRWTGWAPEWDTWERESGLREDAEEALDEWIGWENRVHECIEDIKRNMPFAWPNGVKRERSAAAQAEARESRAAKRARRSASTLEGEYGEEPEVEDEEEEEDWEGDI